MNKFLHLHQKTLCLDGMLERWGGALLALALRLYLGWIFFKAGLTKISDWETTVALFSEEYMVPILPPELAALLGTTGELVLPLLLWAGFLARPAAVGLFMVNVLAVVSYPQLFAFECPAALRDHFYWGVLFIVLMVVGPGRLSLDAVLSRLAKKTEAP